MNSIYSLMLLCFFAISCKTRSFSEAASENSPRTAKLETPHYLFTYAGVSPYAPTNGHVRLNYAQVKDQFQQPENRLLWKSSEFYSFSREYFANLTTRLNTDVENDSDMIHQTQLSGPGMYACPTPFHAAKGTFGKILIMLPFKAGIDILDTQASDNRARAKLIRKSDYQVVSDPRFDCMLGDEGSNSNWPSLVVRGADGIDPERPVFFVQIPKQNMDISRFSEVPAWNKMSLFDLVSSYRDQLEIISWTVRYETVPDIRGLSFKNRPVFADAGNTRFSSEFGSWLAATWINPEFNAAFETYAKQNYNIINSCVSSGSNADYCPKLVASLFSSWYMNIEDPNKGPPKEFCDMLPQIGIAIAANACATRSTFFAEIGNLILTNQAQKLSVARAVGLRVLELAGGKMPIFGK